MASGAHSLLRRLGLGRIAYHALHRPRRALREMRRLGLGTWLARATGDARMRRAASALPPLTVPPAPAHWPPLRFLTGRHHWQQTAFCARSLELAVAHRLRCEFFDDGTLDLALSNRLHALFPGAKIFRVADSEHRVETMLPPARYPALHSVRRLCRYHRKLFDLRSHGGDWSLYLDSDMLFHARPTELLNWMQQPTTNFFLHDAIEGLFDSPETVGRLADGPFVRHLNAGLLTLNDHAIDWDHLEWFTARCSETQRAHRTFEQNLTAVHFGRAGAERLDPSRYRVIYDEFIRPPEGVLVHYCWNSNPCYRAGEWLRVSRHPLVS